MCSALILHHADAAAQESVIDLHPKGDYKLTGTVVNSVSGEPIRRALVTLGNKSVLTDTEGKFEFDDLPREGTTINVRKPGFLHEGRHYFQGDHFYPGRTMHIGPDTPLVTLKLIPEGIIFGKVDSNGEAVNNFPIKLITSQVIDGRRQWVHAAATSTNDDGEFRIADLAAGTYYLSIGPSWTQKALMAGNSNELDEGYAETFYPQASELAGAAAIKIAPGDQTEADFALKPAHLYKVTGFVRGATGRGANLQFLNAEGEAAQFPVHYDPATGGFQTMAPAGSYTLKAQSFTPGTAVTVASMPLNISTDVAGIQLVLAPTISIPVQVQKDAVQPVATNSSFAMNGVDVNGRSYQVSGNDGSEVNVGLHSTEQTLRYLQFTSTYRMVGNTPVMEIQNVEPGKYVANITTGQQWYVESAQCGSVDLLREELPIGVGMQPPPISVTIRNDPAEINGKVSRDAQPGQEQGQSVEAQTNAQAGDEGEEGTKASVLIVPDGRPLGTKEVEVGPNGNFFISGLAPGEYDVLALDHAGELEYMNPEVLRMYLPRAQHVVLQPSQKLQLNLEVVKVE